MRFSERIGARPTSMDVQLDSINIELRNSLWNVVHVFFIQPHRDEILYGELRLIAQRAQLFFFKLPIDDLPENARTYIKSLKEWLLTTEWHQVYDFIEWIGHYGAGLDNWRPGFDEFDNAKRFRSTVNKVLEKERSAYRFVGDHLAPITNVEEVREIEVAAARSSEFEPVGEHIRTAIQLLSDRKEPDFRNSIKEAISAVEAAAKLITKSPKATLGDALKALEKTTNLHSGLKDGILKIYGYTSDANGIRHAMMEKADLSQADARFMLVTCSAFANYLIDRAAAQ